VWLAFVLLSFIQVIIIGVVVYLSNATIIVEREKEHLDQLNNAVNQDLESRIDAFNADALNIVIRDNIKNNLNLADDLEIGKAKRDIVAYLNTRTISTKGYLDISIIDMNANTYSVRATYYLPPDFDIQNTQVFKEAEKYNGGMIWLSSNDVNERYAKDSILLRPLGGISGAAVIKDYTSNEIKGLLVMVIKDNYFRNMEYSNEEIESALFYLVSPDKSIVIPMNSTNSVLNDAILSDIDTAVKRGSFTNGGEGSSEEYLVSFIKNNAMGWYLVSVNTTSDLTATFHRTVKILLITLLLSMIACFFLASGISDYITKGLKALSIKMKRVGKGDFEAIVNSNRMDEVGQLSNVFDSMVKNTNDLIKQKYEQELLTKEAEFRALQAQINPHFLHNTLDMINWRLIEKGEEEISESIVALGNLLRYSIDGDSASAALADEVKNVHDYLFLRHANSNGLFEYSIDVQDADGIMLPKLTLQPIVENAVAHGFAGRQRGNTIRILGRTKEDVYQIEVIDNGIGMTKEKAAQVLANKYEQAMGENHIGLHNVMSRIKHMYNDSQFDIDSKFGYGTCIKIILPMKWKDSV
jgi:two-component system sensor histidine kinase YesM